MSKGRVIPLPGLGPWHAQTQEIISPMRTVVIRDKRKLRTAVIRRKPPCSFLQVCTCLDSKIHSLCLLELIQLPCCIGRKKMYRRWTGCAELVVDFLVDRAPFRRWGEERELALRITHKGGKWENLGNGKGTRPYKKSKGGKCEKKGKPVEVGHGPKIPSSSCYLFACGIIPLHYDQGCMCLAVKNLISNLQL